MAIDRKHFKAVSLEELATPPSGHCTVYKNMWWACLDGKPLLYKESYPQCNSIKSLAERIKPPFADAEAVLVPLAFVKLDISDYC